MIVSKSFTAKNKRGLFFRAEDFLGFVRSVNDVRAAFDKDMQDFETKYENYSDEELFSLIKNKDEYSELAQEALDNVLVKKGRIETILKRKFMLFLILLSLKKFAMRVRFPVIVR